MITYREVLQSSSLARLAIYHRIKTTVVDKMTSTDLDNTSPTKALNLLFTSLNGNQSIKCTGHAINFSDVLSSDDERLQFIISLFL